MTCSALPFCGEATDREAPPAEDDSSDRQASPDRDALVALYNATDGANWTNNTNWLGDAPIGQWYGVTTNASGRVTELDLKENWLSGTIPPALGNLANLTILVLYNNQLSGTIPSALGNLANLQRLFLWGQPVEWVDPIVLRQPRQPARAVPLE